MSVIGTTYFVRNLLVLLSLAALTTAASAQQRTFYDSAGRVAGHSSTDSQGSTTYYDSRGKIVSRESISGNTMTIYDAAGRNVGRFTKGPDASKG